MMYVEDMICADWSAPEGIIAGCTTRTGGESQGAYHALNLGAHVGDDPAAVVANRQAMINTLSLPAEPVWLNQVHSAMVAIEPSPETEADAALTRQVGTICAVMVADCLPVLFCSDDGAQVAAAHAGWRGLVAGVLENTIAGFAASPAELHAWLGPAISQDAFEVGDEVRDAFLEADVVAGSCFVRNDNDRWQADLYGLARRRLALAGVRNISGGGLCTYGDQERFFSYRRDGQCGRMAAFVYRAS
ncbi:MAG: peptidoglycan editing factor PgeF [Woeseiaceae bacterium]|nr:peptidoglycan editing factor PgeF [Woeseiaceae bacterium]